MIDTEKIARDIEQAEQTRDHYKDLWKQWKQEVYRLKTDLGRAERINATHARRTEA